MEASEEYFVLDSSSSSISDQETRGSSKRKRDGDDEEELGDRLSEENLSSQMKHKKIASVRVKRSVDDESDEEIQNEDEDEQIRNTDMPERMQLRDVPITSVEEGSDELDLEAQWINKNAFSKSSVSNQDGRADGKEMVIKGPQTVKKIRKALELIRNQHFEVPYIAKNLKEYFLPEFSANNLLTVSKFDEEWTLLESLKKIMMFLFDEIPKYQSEIKDELMNWINSYEQLSDIYYLFTLHHGNEAPSIQKKRQRERKEAQEWRSSAARRRFNEDGESMDGDESSEDLRDPDDVNVDFYSICVRAGLAEPLKEYGLTPKQLTENTLDNYRRHEVLQTSTEPFGVAVKYVSPEFPTATEVLEATNYMLAVQIAREPLFRQFVRESFFERARIDVIPTKKGFMEIDENHPLYSLKFLKDKPVRDLVEDQFLQLSVAERNGLLTIVYQTEIEGATTASYVDEIKALFTRDESSNLVQKWNDLRKEIIDLVLSKFLFPLLEKKLKEKLLNEAKGFVLRACCQQLYNWLKVAPYKVDFDDEKDTKDGYRIMGLSYDLDEAEICLINVDGECSDHIRLEHILKRRIAWKETDHTGREKDLNTLKDFIFRKKPHVIAVSAESREATMLVEDLRAKIAQLVEDKPSWQTINVELVDNSLAKVFAKSTLAESEFPEFSLLLREAISISRQLQDPLSEYAQLFNANKEILKLEFHPMQGELSEEELMQGLNQEFVNRTNEVGVDINRAIKYPRTAHLLQFICGLGPRKGKALIQTLKQSNQILENRTQFVTACHMGPKVLANCVGFIKFNSNALGDTTESHVEVLDGSRVHPDGRLPYQRLSSEDVFFMVMKETPRSFFIGKLVSATVISFQRRKPEREELDRANPNRNETTGLWQCPFCRKNNFTDATKVSIHFYDGSCSGQANGVIIRLENGLTGNLPMKCLSDSEVKHPEEHVRLGKKIHCRITKINFTSFSVDVTSRPSDLMDRNGVWRPSKDSYYDKPAEDAMLKAEKDSKEKDIKNRQNNTKRVTVHQSSESVATASVQPLSAPVLSAPVLPTSSSAMTQWRLRSPKSVPVLSAPVLPTSSSAMTQWRLRSPNSVPVLSAPVLSAPVLPTSPSAMTQWRSRSPNSVPVLSAPVLPTSSSAMTQWRSRSPNSVPVLSAPVLPTSSSAMTQWRSRSPKSRSSSSSPDGERGRSRSRSPLRGPRRTPSPVLAPPIAAHVENVVAGPFGIFAANPGLLESRLRCQDYERTGRCPYPIDLCPFTHGYVPPCAIHRTLMDIERFRPQQP